MVGAGYHDPTVPVVASGEGEGRLGFVGSTECQARLDTTRWLEHCGRRGEWSDRAGEMGEDTGELILCLFLPSFPISVRTPLSTYLWAGEHSMGEMIEIGWVGARGSAYSACQIMVE